MDYNSVYDQDRKWLSSSYLNHNGDIEEVVEIAIKMGISEKFARDFLYDLELRRKEDEEHLWPLVNKKKNIS